MSMDFEKKCKKGIYKLKKVAILSNRKCLREGKYTTPFNRNSCTCIFFQKAGITMPQFVQTEQQKELVNSMAKELSLYRKKARMSQGDLAAAIGKSRQKISEIERGAAPLGWDTYLAILLVLNAYGALEPKGHDIERLAATSKVVGTRLVL